jgi:MinD superfamily P-loop ATPase
MEITVLSGKGGTGKTTVATNLALSLDNVQFLDADVEEPNSYIFIKPDFGEKYESVWRNIPVIDEYKCNSCRKCIEFCQYNALALLGDNLLVFPEICHSCGGCKHICPEEAIKEEERETGKIRGDLSASDLEFWQGEMNIGEESAVPVIKRLKSHIDDDKTVIIDAPPGTTCPTIEAINDSDYCILVTEATPFGLHDLEMAAELVKELEKPCGIIINRSESGADEIIEEYSSVENIPILLKIPFDRQIAELYSEGIPFVEELPKWKKEFKEVFAAIKKVVE